MLTLEIFIIIGMRPTSPRSGGTYDPSGGYPGGQGGGAGGQHGFPPRGQH